MDKILEITLTVGIIFIAAYSMNVNHQAMKTMNEMNKQIQMMFVRS